MRLPLSLAYFAAASLLLWGCGSTAGSSANGNGNGEDPPDEVIECDAPIFGEGTHEITISHGDGDRTIHVHVPPGLSGETAVPLVLNFHGLGSRATEQILYTGMNTKADEEGFITVHPDGTGITRSWNGGSCCGVAASDDVDDVGFARAIVEYVSARHCIDPRRIYATGMSNGGFMAHRLGCEAADVFAAVSGVTGHLLLPDADCNPGRPVPVLHVHGTADTVVPYEGGGFVAFPPVEAVMAEWAARNGCADEPVEIAIHGPVRCVAWPDCDGAVETILCTEQDGGHTWPGSFHGTQAWSATDGLWAFFERHALP
jgi:polyhydroxybutyrate depolymerase